MRETFAISVPIGSYHPLLHDCLASLSIQTPAPAIAVLDASDDPRVSNVLDKFNDILTYRRSGPDNGQADAIRTGWDNINGEILGWLNADDALYPGALQKAASHFHKFPDTDVFYGNSTIIDDNNITRGYYWSVEPPSERLLSGCTIAQPSCFFRRSAVDQIGGLDTTLHYTMDWDLWTRLWLSGARFNFSEDVLSRILWSRKAKTGGYGKKRRLELNRIIDANANTVGKIKSRLGFGLHHLLEYATPPSTAKYIRRIFRKNRPQIFGMDRTGAVLSRASIPLAHYSSDEKSGFAVSIDGQAPHCMLAVGGSSIFVETPGEHLIPFESPASAGDVKTLTIENKGKKPVYFDGVVWQ
ncbi:MAG: glycosyltransferase [Pseudomonadota bacterium]